MPSLRNSSNPSFFSTNWQMAFGQVLKETNRNELFGRVEVAEAAMFLRYEVIAYGCEHGRERRILKKALLELRLLKNELLGFPGVVGWHAESRDSGRSRRKRNSVRRA